MRNYRDRPPLHSVTVKLDFPPQAEGPQTITGRCWGESTLKRASLWSESNHWTPGEDSDMAPADWASHLILVSLQDRPNTAERLLFGLTGGLGVQDPLF